MAPYMVPWETKGIQMKLVESPGNAGTKTVCVNVLPDGRMTRKEAARYLGNTPKTLANWATQGKGPPSVLVGGRRFYFKADLDAFIAAG